MDKEMKNQYPFTSGVHQCWTWSGVRITI